MNMSTPTAGYFQPGGTLAYSVPSYVKRKADDQIRAFCHKGGLCYILDARQTGKSSLIARTKEWLEKDNQGFRTVHIDLTKLGTETDPDTWYFSIADEIHYQLELEEDIDAWWERHNKHTRLKLLNDFLTQIVLKEIDEQVVIFVDEIDTVVRYSFSDDFFAAIRALFNQRATNPETRRLTFVLVGAVAPNDLIKDPKRTPFNVGTRIILEDLKLEESGPLLEGLPNQDPQILSELFQWTNGHPYLTQRLCQTVAAENEHTVWSRDKIEMLVRRLFLSGNAMETESNLRFIRDGLLAKEEERRIQVLSLYRKLWVFERFRIGRIANDEQSVDQDRLKMSGLVRVNEQGNLTIRNEIYRQAFDWRWVDTHMPRNWRTPILLAFVILSVFLLILLVVSYQRSDRVLAQSYMDSFQSTTNPTLRLDSLANLFRMDGYEEQALELYAGLSTNEQIDLFASLTPDLQDQAETVIRATYRTIHAEDLTREDPSTGVLEAMYRVLEGSDDSQLTTIIERWIEARRSTLEQSYDDALIQYGVVLGLGRDNPAALHERAQVNLLSGHDADALEDLDGLLVFGDAWTARVNQMVLEYPQLHARVFAEPTAYRDFVALIPTPTDTATPTATSTATTTPKPTETPTATQTPTPTETMTPTSTSTPTATPTQTVTSSPTAAANNEASSPGPTAEPPVSTTATLEPTDLGRILYSANRTLLTTDPDWSVPRELGTVAGDTCGSVAETVTGASYRLYRSPKCEIGTGASPKVCPSPDGLYEVIASFRDGTIVIRERGNGEAGRWVFTGTFDHAEGILWSPRSDSFIFVVGDSLKVVPVTGTEYDLAFPAYSPSFSLDGSMVLYEKPMPTGGRDYFVINANGSNERNVTNTASVSKSCPAWRY